MGHDDEGGEQRAERAAGLTAHLEDALRQTLPAAGSLTRQTGRFGMKDRRTDADAGDRDENDAVTRREAEAGQPTRVKAMPTMVEYGIGRRSVTKPTTGLSSEPAIWKVRDEPDLTKSSA